MTAIASSTRYVYDFAEGSRDMRVLLGGKGANIAEMTRVLGADLVPAGFTITTEACVDFMRDDRVEPAGLAEQVAEGIARLEERAGRRLGDPDDPLLVSVRSGARDSMPGMLETILDLGLNDASVVGLAARTGDEHFAWDSCRRFVQMFGNVVRGVPGERYEEILRDARRRAGVREDRGLSVAQLQDVTRRFRVLYEGHTGEPFPQDPVEQLRLAIGAVFDSWLGDRAVAYRRINHIPDDWGTAVNVQQMVFGNRGAGSATGVAFSRDELTGAPEPSGDFLLDAQGEDVVSGVRTPRPLHELAEELPEAHAKLLEILRTLEAHYGDLQDTEFTVERGRLYMLQTRSAKRPAQAAVRFAVDAVDERMLTPEQALRTIDAGSLDALLHPTFDPEARFQVLARGVAASPGAAKGEIVFTAEEAVAAAAQSRDVILARPFTEADDVAGFHAARGILTSEGGKASHAALVARGMGRPAVVGAGELEIDLRARVIRAGDEVIAAGERIAIDGSTGMVTRDDVPLVEAARSERFERVLGWADEIRRLGVRANADTPADALNALEHGAEGIGLCRTEHMFMAADRQPKMRAMIMARTEPERRAALAELLPLQQADFEGLFAAMPGRPITIRLLDPAYLERRILDRSPFETVDVDGVGALVETAVRLGRSRREGLELGVCGEHGGDPDSIAFFHRAGLDYVSCSPYRLPIARVAAAQAALR
jgi:pyruvate,orthophosphate dikinase